MVYHAHHLPLADPLAHTRLFVSADWKASSVPTPYAVRTLQYSPQYQEFRTHFSQYGQSVKCSHYRTTGLQHSQSWKGRDVWLTRSEANQPLSVLWIHTIQPLNPTGISEASTSCCVSQYSVLNLTTFQTPSKLHRQSLPYGTRFVFSPNRTRPSRRGVG